MVMYIPTRFGSSGALMDFERKNAVFLVFVCFLFFVCVSDADRVQPLLYNFNSF